MENGKKVPYGPWRYKNIVKECIIISQNLHTSYTDLMNVTPIERSYMYEYLKEESDKLRARMEKQKEELEAKNKANSKGPRRK